MFGVGTWLVMLVLYAMCSPDYCLTLPFLLVYLPVFTRYLLFIPCVFAVLCK